MADGSWEQNALWWQREFTDGVDPEYVEQIIPIVLQHLALVHPLERVVDVGTGEGQVARAIRDSTGAAVTGVDPTDAQLELARQRGGGIEYKKGTSDRLPVDDESFDAAVVCLVFEHVDKLDESLAEIARALRPGGRLVLLLNHPLLQTPGSGMIVDHMIEPPETYWRIGPYLTEASGLEEVQKDVLVRFVHRPLSRYVNAMVAQGLTLVHMHEPAPPPGFIAKAQEYEHDIVATTPRLLALVADRTVTTIGEA